MEKSGPKEKHLPGVSWPEDTKDFGKGGKTMLNEDLTLARVNAPNYTWSTEDIKRSGHPAVWVHQRVTKALAEGAQGPVPKFSRGLWWSDTVMEIALAPLHHHSPLLQPAMLHQNDGLYVCRSHQALESMPADAASRGTPPLTVVACGLWPKNDGAPSGVWGLVVQVDAPPVMTWASMDGTAKLPNGLYTSLVKSLRAASAQLRLPNAETQAVRVRAPATVALLMADALSPRPTTHPAAFEMLEELVQAQPARGWDQTNAQLAYLAAPAGGGPGSEEKAPPLGSSSTQWGAPRAASLVPLSGRMASLHGTMTRTPDARVSKVTVPPYLRQLARQSASVQEMDDALREKADQVLLREFNAVQKCVGDWIAKKCDEVTLWGALNRLEGFLRMARSMAERHVYQHVQNTAAMNARAVFEQSRGSWLAHGRSFMWPLYTLTAWSSRERDGEVDGERLVPVAHVWHLNAGLGRLAETVRNFGRSEHRATRRLVDLWLESVSTDALLDTRQVSKQPWNDTLWGTAGSVLMIAEWLQTTPPEELDEPWDSNTVGLVMTMLTELREDVRGYLDHFWCHSAWRASAHFRPDAPGVHAYAIGWAQNTTAVAPSNMRKLMEQLAQLDVDGLYAHVYAQLHKALTNDKSPAGALFAPQMLESATWRWTYDHETGRLPLIGPKDKIDQAEMRARMAPRNTAEFARFRGGAVRDVKTLQALFDALAPVLTNGTLPPLKGAKKDLKTPAAEMPLSGLVELSREAKSPAGARLSKGEATRQAECDAWQEMADAADMLLS